MIPLVVPQEDVNSETATLNTWLVEDGAAVKKGQAVCEVETTKTIFEVTASADGWLVRGAEEHARGWRSTCRLVSSPRRRRKLPARANNCGRQRQPRHPRRQQTRQEKSPPAHAA